MSWVYCPYCGFGGDDNVVDEHRTTHSQEPQEGSNLGNSPRL